MLSGIGTKSADKFHDLGIETVEDLIMSFPFRFDQMAARPVSELVDGEKVVLVGIVVTAPSVQYFGGKKSRLTFSIKQGDAVIAISFFNQPFLAKHISLGEEIAVWGKWDHKRARLSAMRLVAQSHDSLQAVYHIGSGITQKTMRRAIQSAHDLGYFDLIQENLPQEWLDEYRLLDRKTAVYYAHFPGTIIDYQQAIRRLKFEELVYFQIQLQDLKIRQSLTEVGAPFVIDHDALKNWIDALPFDLTKAQKKVTDEILSDLERPYRMNRLLQGDVGSGKTVVAATAIKAAAISGYQSALMVPTEILAEQHLASLSALLPDEALVLLTGSLSAKEKKERLSRIKTGEARVIIGTHALIQEGVAYHNLGLIIIDEQHRFGVGQRRLLREKADHPHLLMMTATPIPRTLAITAFGDMDLSVIDELPAGRKPIMTRWVKKGQAEPVWSWLKDSVESGQQAYVVTPLIEESESLNLQNAVDLTKKIKDLFVNQETVALLHGQMKAEEKEVIMRDFSCGKIKVLVSTTVIEVGVNVPNSSIMVIVDADRFGLSQLHQLRGRVGRGDKQSYTILIADPKTDAGKERMRLMCETGDGFVLAEADLQMRGSGEIFGVRQSGLPEFHLANLVEDYPILEEARKKAQSVVSSGDWKKAPRWQVLAAHLPEGGFLD